MNWSPEQIGGWLKRSHPGDESHCVSPRTPQFHAILLIVQIIYSAAAMRPALGGLSVRRLSAMQRRTRLALNGQTSRARVCRLLDNTGQRSARITPSLYNKAVSRWQPLGLDGHLAVPPPQHCADCALNDIQNAVLDASVIRVMGLTNKNPTA
ncbi:MAG TPA: hypothetical protein VFC54_13570 [Pseudolabrys sp.]|nr:hypothetical protein [Pseudolabrys sp.]